MKVVSYTSVLSETVAAHLQYDLSSRRSFASHHTLIYSPYDLLFLDEKCNRNKSISEIVLIKERSRPPMALENDNS